MCLPSYPFLCTQTALKCAHVIPFLADVMCACAATVHKWATTSFPAYRFKSKTLHYPAGAAMIYLVLWGTITSKSSRGFQAQSQHHCRIDTIVTLCEEKKFKVILFFSPVFRIKWRNVMGFWCTSCPALSICSDKWPRRCVFMCVRKYLSWWNMSLTEADLFLSR